MDSGHEKQSILLYNELEHRKCTFKLKYRNVVGELADPVPWSSENRVIEWDLSISEGYSKSVAGAGNAIERLEETSAFKS
jgi:hypothetical protein